MVEDLKNFEALTNKVICSKNDNIIEHELISDSPEIISLNEFRLRKFAEFVYRFLFSVFLSAHLFDFFFNPIWMHGYIW